VPEGDWFKDFGSFKICSSGSVPKTFLLRGQAAKGYSPQVVSAPGLPRTGMPRASHAIYLQNSNPVKQQPIFIRPGDGPKEAVPVDHTNIFLFFVDAKRLTPIRPEPPQVGVLNRSHGKPRSN
jgi:hypothetical protein